MPSFPKAPPSLLLIYKAYSVFIHLPSKTKLSATFFSMEVPLARDMTVLWGTPDSHYAAVRWK